MGLVWFPRHCGKMYSRHLFSYGGLSMRSLCQLKENLIPQDSINTRSLNSDLDGHLSKVKLDNYNAHPRSDRSKTSCEILSCTRSRTSWNSLVLFSNFSSFQIQLSILHFHPQAFSSLFRTFRWKSARS